MTFNPELYKGQVARAETRCRQGALLLDTRNPGWADQINLEALNMADTNSCVCGQVFGGYMRGLSVLFDTDEEGAYSSEMRDDMYGFAIFEDLNGDASVYDDYDWDQLAEAWKPLIEARQTR